MLSIRSTFLLLALVGMGLWGSEVFPLSMKRGETGGWFFLPAFFRKVGVLQAEELTLERAIEIARKNAFSVLTAQAELRRAEGSRREAFAGGLPRLTLEGSYTRFTDENRVQFDPSRPPVTFRPIERASIQLRLAQTVDVWGVVRLATEAASAQKEAQSALVLAAMNDAELSAKIAFFRLLEAGELERVAEEAVQNARLRLEIARKRVSAEVAPQFEIIRAEAELSSAEQELLRARNGVALAQSALNNTLARPVDIPVKAVPVEALPRVTLSLEDLTRIALTRRPELSALEQNVEIQRRVVRARERSLLPIIELSAQVVRDPFARGFGSEKDVISGTAFISVPLFEGGRVRAQVAQAREEEQKARLRLEEARLGVALEVRQAYLDLQTAWQVMESSQKNVAQAEEAHRIALIRYEAGLSTPVEVSDASLLLTRARTALATARYAYREAYARLERAVGGSLESSPLKEEGNVLSFELELFGVFWRSCL
jgi:outer membrane protein